METKYAIDDADGFVKKREEVFRLMKVCFKVLFKNSVFDSMICLTFPFI